MKSPALLPIGLAAIATVAKSAQMTDSFSNRPQVGGLVEILDANTSSATRELGEPDHGTYRDRTAWGKWIAPANGWVTIDTSGSFENAVLVVYTGETLSSLLPVASSKSNITSPASVTFPVGMGTAYNLVIDGYSNSVARIPQNSGIGKVNIHLIPSDAANAVTGADQFASRGVLIGPEAFGIANNVKATRDPWQPKNTGYYGRDVWWQWTAPATGMVTIDTVHSGFDTELTVFSGNPVSDPPWNELHMVARNDDLLSSGVSGVKFQTEAGRTYQIAAAAGSSGVVAGNLILKLSLSANTAPAAVPGTDLFADRLPLPGLPSMGIACNTFAGKEAYEKFSYGEIGKSVWWTWTATETGPVEIHTKGSETDTILRVYQGDSISTLVEIKSNNDAPGVKWSSLVLSAIAGETYQIRVDHRGSTYSLLGNIVLNLNPVPAPEIEVRQPVTSLLVDGVSKRNFGAVRIGRKSARMTYVIENTGTAPLTGLRIYQTGSHSRDFIVSPLAKTSLAPGERVNLVVIFKPLAKGARAARVSIISNDTDEASFDVTVNGRGLAR